MKLKTLIVILSIALTGIAPAYAATDITGDIYGNAFRNMSLNDGTFPYGVSIDDVGEASENCDNLKKVCYLKGFSWSDVVGWTYWDGATLQSELGAVFPDEYIAKAAYNGNIGGYIWGEKFGWISLSKCDGLASGECTARSYCEWTGNNRCEVNKTVRVPDAVSQDINDWGVYIDFCSQKSPQSACENVADGSDTYCNWDSASNVCIFDIANNPNGHPLGGYAWSQYLGWIKFGPKGSDADFTGAFTNWIPDSTPPEFTAVLIGGSYAWIPSETSTGAIVWNEFANDDESSIDALKSFVTVSAVDNGASEDFATCPDPGVSVFSPTPTGEANLNIAQIGFVGTPPYGYCKYTIGGVIYNGVGLGHYFGPEGLAQAVIDGVNTTNPDLAAPNTYANEGITLYVRAGDLVQNYPYLIGASNNNVIADGHNVMNTVFSPRDLAGNPIISVKSGLDGMPDPSNPDNWIRNVELMFDLNTSPYAFDSISFVRNLSYPVPVEIEGEWFSYSGDLLQYPSTGLTGLSTIDGRYRMDVTGFAPSTVAGNNLRIHEINFATNDLELPAVSSVQGPWLASSGPIVLNSSTSSTLPLNYFFQPALVVTDGSLNADFLALNQPAVATFKFANNSAYILTEFGIDNVLDFYDESFGSELLEVENINLIGLSDIAGRTDPNGPGSRYGLIHSSSGDFGMDFNQFHDSSDNFHEPVYLFENSLSPSGEYFVSGNAFVAPGDPCIEDSSCPVIGIDRSDPLNLLIANDDDSFAFHFTPTRYIGASSSDQISFGIDQYLSYNPNLNHFSQHAVYPADPWIDDILVKSIGIDTSGTVSGQQVYESGGGRDLASITTTSSADLRREIRRNVAVLTRNLTPCLLSDPLSVLSTDASNCISVDQTNKTVVAYYKSDSNVVTLGNGSDIPIPDGYRYTIIIQDNDLFLASNLVYPANPATSFGIIVIQDSDGQGGNVYLSPNPTNIVGLLYAEGSLFSSPDAGVSLYYTSSGPDTSDLTNQLFWQGSLASRNTIGGTTRNIVPEGADCSKWDSISACSQAYDLDFTRRFSTTKDSVTGNQYAPVGTKFSGGGSCVDTPTISCTLGTLPTTISLFGNFISPASKSLNTFFVERDNRPVPPGFSSQGGLTSTQEIR